ncbi:hypothetical protein [Paraburkholderia terrae]|uniref:hypothetical protein n=1 Tax=Paraburkholderia terrae TaxID=311230 RepID=UPI002056766F|nr:hypothetical protein [Paraburkholderia terrae]BDC39156.1 hypothetical protein PTKU15_24530 [Paraburkholderia terrae]
MNTLPIATAHVQLPDLARHVIETEGWDVKALQVLDPLWQIFVHFVLAPGAVADPAASITAGTLEAFARHCDLEGGVPFEDAPVILGAVRLILSRSGFDAQTLAALSAPRRRKRGGQGKANVYKIARPHPPHPGDR